jgi:hypothetical protein
MRISSNGMRMVIHPLAAGEFRRRHIRAQHKTPAIDRQWT